jgi:hypothetical protein
MNLFALSNFLTPIHPVEQKIRCHYDRLGLPVPFEEFRAHATAAAQTTNASTVIEHLALPSPSFFATHVEPTQPQLTRLHKKRARRNAELLAELEPALINCMAARRMTPKPLLSLLNEALRFCDVHDAHVARYAQEDEAAKRRCVRGGHERHRNHRRLLCMAIRFLRTMARASSWKSKTHAADTIGPHLCLLGIKHKLKVSESEETWAHNVLKLMRTNPRADQAFQLHCSPRRSNRSHRLPR